MQKKQKKFYFINLTELSEKKGLFLRESHFNLFNLKFIEFLIINARKQSVLYIFMKENLPILLSFLLFVNFFTISALPTPSAVGKNGFKPKTLVKTFSHVSQAAEANDTQILGQQWAQRYYHIKTGLRRSDLVMFRFDLQGYAYGIAAPLDITWCGYNFLDGFLDQEAKINRNMGQSQIHIHQYYLGDSLVLSFGPLKRYCNAFSLYFEGHYGPSENIERGMDEEEYKVIATANPGQLAISQLALK